MAAGDTLVTGEGLKGETYDRALAVSAVTPASGGMRAATCPLTGGVVVGSVVGGLTAAGVGMTHGWYLIFDRSSNLLAQTADSPASFQTTGLVTLALTAALTIPSTAVYFLAFLGTTGTSMPSFIGVSTGGGAGTASLTTIGSGTRRQGQQAGLSAPPNPAVLADVAASVWLGAL